MSEAITWEMSDWREDILAKLADANIPARIIGDNTLLARDSWGLETALDRGGTLRTYAVKGGYRIRTEGDKA